MKLFTQFKTWGILAISLTLSLHLHSNNEPTFVLYDMQVNNDGSIAELNSGNTSIKISGTRVTKYNNIGAGYILSCLNPEGPSFDNCIYVNDEVTGQPSGSLEHSYILIENKGTTAIERIEFVGMSSSSEDKSNLICFISREDEGYFAMEGGGRYLYSTSNSSMTSYIPQTIAFDDNQNNACSYSYDIPEVVYKYDRGAGNSIIETINDLKKDIKYIRLNWSSASFAGSSTSNRGKPLILLGLRIFMENDNPVNIETQEQEKLIIQRKQNGLYSINSVADIQVFNMQGQLIISQKQTDSFDISSSPKGIYIIKAIADNRTVSQSIIH